MFDLTGAATKFVRAVYDPAIDAVRDTTRAVGSGIDDLVRTERASADETVREVRDAWHAQPTIERSIVAGGWQLLENSVQRDVRRAGGIAAILAAATAGAGRIAFETNPIVQGARATAHVAEAGARGGVAALGEAANGARRIVERTVESRAESARQVGDAIRDVGRSEVDSARRTAHAVQDAWRDQPTIERKLAVGGFRIVEGGIRATIDRHVAAGNVVREVGEAAVRDATTGIHNLGDALVTNVRATGAFLSGLFGG